MAFNSDGFEEVKIMIDRLAKSAVNITMEQITEAGEEIQALAKLMSPVDYGNLENAIKIRRTGGALRDGMGRFVKGGGFIIYVDNSLPAVDDQGQPVTRNGEQVTVGDYAWWVSENVTPAGYANLGAKSQNKQDALAGHGIQVGGHFMERAAEKVTVDLALKIGSIIARRYSNVDK